MKGVSILSDLFLDTKEPTFIFNQGRCFEQNRRFEEAVSRFEEYLRVTDGKIKPSDKAEAEKHLASCQEQLAKERSLATVQPPPPPPVIVTPPPPPETKPTVVETTPPPDTTLTDSPAATVDGKPRWGLVTAGIITGTVGLGGIVVGVIFNQKANSDIQAMEAKPDAYTTAKSNDQKSNKTLSMVGYGVGAAGVIAGAVLLGFGLKTGKPASTNLALAPALGPDSVGAIVTGGF